MRQPYLIEIYIFFRVGGVGVYFTLGWNLFQTPHVFFHKTFFMANLLGLNLKFFIRKGKSWNHGRIKKKSCICATSTKILPQCSLPRFHACTVTMTQLQKVQCHFDEKSVLVIWLNEHFNRSSWLTKTY